MRNYSNDRISRLERDVIVFRGGEDEATDQILKGAVVLCLKSPLKVETIQLCFGGTLRQSYVIRS